MSVTISTAAAGENLSLNLANGNFSTLWNALALPLESPDDWCGEIDPREVLAAIDSVDPQLIHRADVVEYNDDSEVRFWSCGIDAERANRYLATLRRIAAHAIKVGQPIYWG